MPRLSISTFLFLFPLFGKARASTFSKRRRTRKYLRFLDDPSGEYFFSCYELRCVREKRVCPYKAKKCALHALESETESVNSQLARWRKEKIRRAKERKMEGKLMYAHLGKQQTSPFSSFTSERTGLTKQPKEKRKQKAEEEETLFFYAKLLCESGGGRDFFPYKKGGGREWHLRLSRKNKITRLFFVSPPSPPSRSELPNKSPSLPDPRTRERKELF